MSTAGPLKGEFLRSANIVNTMIKQLSIFTSEVTRVAREVGTDGKLGGQAQVREVTGVWKDLTESVNSMASNLTAQVRNLAEVTIAVANGDLSKKITVDVRGEILQLKEAINTMVDQLRSFASEVTRVAREVGTEGKLGGQALVPGVAGTWKDLTDSVNAMCGNLTAQVRNIAQVTTAVARGDLSRKITVHVSGEILELKETINTMVDQLNGFAGEVTRVAREVGTEGRLGGQAQVPGVAGTWKDLTDNVNSMASNLTAQVRNIAEVSTAIASGNLAKKITVTVSGEILELKETINTMVDQLNAFASEVTRVAREVGTEGRLGGQANVLGVAGTWKDLTENVNSMASNLTGQVRNIAEVTTAVANGDLSKKITVDVKGEILELKDTINTMVDQLNAFAGEVTRVAREVGTEGKLGGQAQLKGVAGTWKDLTDSVNSMASNLTGQVRNIAEVATAVAQGDLSKKITVTVSGEILLLKETLNTMVDQPGNGLGYWPAFWMLGPGQWPENGEIDIMEDVNALSELSGTVHCGTYPGGPCNEPNGIGSGLQPCPGCQSGFHTYSMILNRTNPANESITFYLDGNQYFHVSESQVGTSTWQAAFDHNLSIIFDLAMGGGYPNGVCGCTSPTSSTSSGGTMNVAYVRGLPDSGVALARAHRADHRLRRPVPDDRSRAPPTTTRFRSTPATAPRRSSGPWSRRAARCTLSANAWTSTRAVPPTAPRWTSTTATAPARRSSSRSQTVPSTTRSRVSASTTPTGRPRRGPSCRSGTAPATPTSGGPYPDQARLRSYRPPGGAMPPAAGECADRC